VVNDTAGHAAGDGLLKEVSSLFRSQLRRVDTLARLGGDEFGVLLDNCDVERAEIIAQQFVELLKNYNYEWAGKTFKVGASVGIVVVAENADLASLMSLVDAACYAAKDSGRNQVHVYSDDDKELKRRRTEMQRATDAVRAIDNKQLVLHAQKIQGLDTEDDSLWYEILVRMKGQDGTLIYPDDFIPALEQYGGIQKMDSAIIGLSMEYMSKHPGIRFNINLSGSSIGDENILARIKQLITRYKINPEKLVFEITETAAMLNVEHAKLFINELKRLGCSIALDDFGSGMSSYGYLQNLNVDYVKLDGSFVRDMDENAIHYAMVESINSIVKVMGKETIAEFVENKAVEKCLNDLGVAYGQGYHLHKPEALENISITGQQGSNVVNIS